MVNNKFYLKFSMKTFIFFTLITITAYSHLYSMEYNEKNGYSIQQLVESGKINNNSCFINPYELNESNCPKYNLILTAHNIQCMSGIYSIPNISNDYMFITTLNLSKNKLSQLPTQFFDQFISLRILNFSYNKLTSLPAINKKITPQLTHIYLNNNQLQTLPEELLSQTRALQFLELQNNKLIILPQNSLSFTPNLQAIDLSNNQLIALPNNFLSDTPNLYIANLNNNQLSNLPKNFFSFDTIQNLVCLRLHNNNLTTLSNNHFLQHARSLSTLRLDQNSLTQLPDNFIINSPKINVLKIQNKNEFCPSHNLLAPHQKKALKNNDIE